jgi:dihydropteroate synthase
MERFLNCAGARLDLQRPQVMGVLNVTPDSFSDGGRYLGRSSAVRRAEQMVADGASIIDVGGESTRPGSSGVSVNDELDRVIPVVEALVKEFSIPISVDTSKPEVMREALSAGAVIVNDVRALRAPGALAVLSENDVPVCLMHMQGDPATMQSNPSYEDVIAEVKTFLEERIRVCELSGIGRHRIIVDPGFGFGKTLSQNVLLLKRLNEFRSLDVPLLVGLSRKSMIGTITDAPIEDRLYGSLSAAVIAVWQGANIVRVHDVKSTVQALQVCTAVMHA